MFPTQRKCLRCYFDRIVGPCERSPELHLVFAERSLKGWKKDEKRVRNNPQPRSYTPADVPRWRTR